MTDQFGPTPSGDPVPSWQPPPPASDPTPPAAWTPAPIDQSVDPWGRAAWGATPWSAPAPPPPPPRHRARTATAVILLIAGGAAAGAGVTYAVRPKNSTALGTSTPTRVPTATLPAVQGAPTTLVPLPTAPPPSSSGGGSSTPLDPNAIAAKIDPALVDINISTGQGTAAGTGMILTSSGEVLTNNHVVEGATSITVQVDGTGPEYPATVIGVDPTDDVALIQMQGASGLPTVPLGDSSQVAVGDQILALGNALGRGGTPAPTQGTVTALNQTITASDSGGANSETLTGMIQVQAGIQPGDSGGPMVDSTGHVIAMTTAGSARARRSGTVGFGIPIDKALSVATQIQTGSGPNVQGAHRGILGVSIDTSADGSGAAVNSVEAGSPAERAGIAQGAVITGIDGTSVDSAATLGTALQGKKPGDIVTVKWNDASGSQHTARVTLESGPPA